MDLMSAECLTTDDSANSASRMVSMELTDLQLALVGGGIGDTQL